MARVTRFPNGIGDSPVLAAMGDLPIFDPSKMHVFFDDFDYFDVTEWELTQVGAGIQSLISQTEGGILRNQTGATGSDNSFLSTAGSGFDFELGKRIFFSTVWRVESAGTFSDVVAGLQDRPSALVPSDGIYFQKEPDADQALDLLVRSGSVTVASVSGIATVEDNTFLKMEFGWDGVDTIIYSIDGATAQFLRDVSIIPAVITAPMFGVQTETGARRELDVDYIFAAKER